VGIFDFDQPLQWALANLTERGVFTVFYLTETVQVFDQQCALQSKLRVSEIWHYARSNLASCPPLRVGKHARYVPPGYHAPSRLAASALPSGEASPPLRATNRSWVLFPGTTLRYYSSRRQCLDSIQRGLAEGAGLRVAHGSARTAGQGGHYRCKTEPATTDQSTSWVAKLLRLVRPGRLTMDAAEGACPLASTNEAHDEASWSREIARYGFFVSVHKMCTTNASAAATPAVRGAAETFRFAPLLSAGGLVFSERVHAADEAELAPFVRFAPVEGLARLVLAEAARNDSLSAAAVQRRADAYARSFNAEAIFQRAGLLSKP